jgi:biopolymer transport protein ExbD
MPQRLVNRPMLTALIALLAFAVPACSSESPAPAGKSPPAAASTSSARAPTATATASAVASPVATTTAVPAPVDTGLLAAVPGIVVDAKAKEVRVAATVCLQKGGLELFACNRGTREHESIFVTLASPSDISRALASLGLPPGQAAFTTEGGAASPPAGAVLEASVRFFKVTDEEKARVRKLIAAGTKPEAIEIAKTDWFTVPAWKLLKASGGGEGLDRPFDWVYIGPTDPATLRSADHEGTFMCLSNWFSAIVDVPFESGRAWADLLYEANPEVVPPVGTPAELIIHPTDRTIEPKKIEWVVVLRKGAKPVVDGKPMDLDALKEAASAAPADIRTAVLKADAEESFGRVMEVKAILQEALMQVSLVVLQKAGPAAARPAPVEVRITADDAVRLGNRTITVDEFRARTAEFLKSAEVVNLILDPKASPKAVAEVMAAARITGAQVYLLHDEPSKDATPKK